MTQTYRKTLLAGAIAALLVTPMIATGEVTPDGAQAPDVPQAEQQWRDETTTDRTTTGGSTDQPQTRWSDSQEGTLPEMERPMGYTAEDYEKKSVPQQGDSPRPADRTAGAQVSENPLYSRSFDDLDGMDVTDRAGERIGTLKGIVVSPDRRSADSVISSGGLLGVGMRETLVPFSELTSMDDHLQMNTTEEAFKARSEFQSDDYIALDGDRPIREAIVAASAYKLEHGSDQRRDNLPRAEGQSESEATTPARSNESN